MATASGKARCVTCGKEKAVMKCGGCSQDFCFNHMTDHRQELSKQMDEVEVTRDLFRQTLTEQTSKPQKHALMQEIDQWENDSIQKIRETAKEARAVLLKHTDGYFKAMEVKLNKLTDQLRESREENDFIEKDLEEWKKQLQGLEDELHKPSEIIIRHDRAPLVTKICVSAFESSSVPTISASAKWTQNGVTVAGGNGGSSGVNQLCYPSGIYIDDDQTVYIADCGNHRIVEWKDGATSGRVVAGGKGSGNRADQLSGPIDVIIDKKRDSFIISDYGNNRVMRWPRQNGTSGEILISNIRCSGLDMDKDGYLYVSDRGKHEVRRWRIGDASGTVVVGGKGQGCRLDQLSVPTFLYIDQDHAVYVSDEYNHRVMKWTKGAKEGIVVAGDQGPGNDLTQLNNPYGVVVDQSGTVYVVDHNNHRVVRWPKGATQGSVVVGGNGGGAQANQLQHPIGLSFDRQGNLYVVEQSNHRIQKFNIQFSTNS